MKCEAVLVPGNTSHFSQPCDQLVNQRFQNQMCIMGDTSAHCQKLDIRSIGIRLLLAVKAHGNISASDCSILIAKTDLYPFDRNLGGRFNIPIITIEEDFIPSPSASLVHPETLRPPLPKMVFLKEKLPFPLKRRQFWIASMLMNAFCNARRCFSIAVKVPAAY